MLCHHALLLLLVRSSMASLMVPIEWSLNGIPQIFVEVNGVTELRPISTSRSDFFVHNATANGYMVDAHVNVSGLNFSYIWRHARLTANIQELFYPLGRMSGLSTNEDINWLSMTPQGFHLVPFSVPFNPDIFCQNASEARSISSHRLAVGTLLC